MIEIPAFPRRHSARDSNNLQDHSAIAGPVEPPPARTTSTSKRLTKVRPAHSPAPFRAWSDTAIRPERGSRLSLIEFARRPLENRGSRFFQLFQGSLPSTLSEDHLLTSPELPVATSNHFTSRDTTDSVKMSVDLLKTVAKKTSLKNLLCDKIESSTQESIDFDAAITLLKELKKRASPEELVALHRALLPVKDATAPGGADDSLQSPYSRRSSVITPGLATRTKSPSKSPKERSSFLPWDLSLTPQKRRPSSDQFPSAGSNASPLLRHSASAQLQPHKGIPAFARSYSPANLDIAAIGSLGLGTLRVTNGAVSPEPSVVSEVGPEPITSHPLSSQRGVEVREQPSIDNQSSALLTSLPSNNSRDGDRKTVQSDSLRELSLTAVKYLRQSAEKKPETTSLYGNNAFNASTGSFASRLSTILDDESMFMEGNDERRSDPQNQFTKRPDIMAKKDSGYLSDPQAHSRCSSSEGNMDDLVEAAHLRTPLRPMHVPLETIPSVSTLVSTAPASSNVGVDSEGARHSMRDFSGVVSPRLNDADSQLSPLQRNPPTRSGPTTPILCDSEEGDFIGPDRSQKPRNKLQKPPPHIRSKSDGVTRAFAQSGIYPSIPDDMSTNFSRRINRIPGSFHPEHAYAANARLSKESLSLQEGVTDTTSQSKNVASTAAKADKHTDLATKDTASPAAEVKKKRSLFRLRGRARSKSRTRTDVQLPLERDTPTVADTVPQHVDASAEKENRFRFPDDFGSKGKSAAQADQPRVHVKSDKPASDDHGVRSESRSRNRILADKSDSQGQASHTSRHRRSESMPRAPSSSKGTDASASQQYSSSKQRSKSVAPPRNRSSQNRSHVLDEMTHVTPAVPHTPQMQSSERWEPVTPSVLPKTPRDGSAPNSDGFNQRSRGHRRNFSGSAQMNSPAYIAYHPASPTPGASGRSQRTPRTLPWESTQLPAVPQRQHGLANASDDREEELRYRAYREADAVSIRRLTSPTRDGHLRVLHIEQRRGALRDISRTPSPANVVHKSEGLDFGWEKDATTAR